MPDARGSLAAHADRVPEQVLGEQLAVDEVDGPQSGVAAASTAAFAYELVVTR
jgi:hypothetical protein